MMKLWVDNNIVLYLLLVKEPFSASAIVPTNEEIWEEYFLKNAPPRTLDFRQAAGLGQEMWSRVGVEKYIQQERDTWD